MKASKSGLNDEDDLDWDSFDAELLYISRLYRTELFIICDELLLQFSGVASSTAAKDLVDNNATNSKQK